MLESMCLLMFTVISQTALNGFIKFTNRGRRDLVSSSSSSFYISVRGSSGYFSVEYFLFVCLHMLFNT